MYADRDGHIGYQAPGRIPIRKPATTATDAGRRAGYPQNDWTGDYVPFDALPNVLDPDEGSSSPPTRRSTGPDYPYFLTDDWDYGYRVQRIRDLLEAARDELSRRRHGGDPARHPNPMAPTLVPYLLDIRMTTRPATTATARTLLRDWDFTQPADCAAAAYFNVGLAQPARLTFHDELPERTWPDGGDRWFAVVEQLLDEPDSTVVGRRGHRRRRRDPRRHPAPRRCVDARDELTRREAREPANWTVGQACTSSTCTTQTLGESGIGPVERLFNRGRLRGRRRRVDRRRDRLGRRPRATTVTAAPSMRMVVSLGRLRRLPLDQPHRRLRPPVRPHYTDQTELWVGARRCRGPTPRVRSRRPASTP